MIPKFKRPISSFTLGTMAVVMWFAAGAILLDSWIPQTGGPMRAPEPSGLIVPVVLLIAGLLMLGLCRMIHYAAESSHYLKYLCWEHRIANQLAEKKKAVRPVPPPTSITDLSTLEPVERIFRSVESCRGGPLKGA
jgi:hypothetical protein